MLNALFLRLFNYYFLNRKNRVTDNEFLFYQPLGLFLSFRFPQIKLGIADGKGKATFF